MTGWFFENMAWASLAMLIVLAVRRPVASMFGAGPAYALWLLPFARLILPPLPPLGAEMPSLLPPLTLMVPAGEGAPVPGDGGSPAWLTLLLAAWALGAFAFLVWQWLAYRAFLAGLSRSSRSLGEHRGLALIESEAVRGPLAVGLLDRRIVVPADFATRYSPEERRLALDHECVHHRRGNIWWNLAGLLILALNWFNPIAWVGFGAFRADQELACDAAVAARAAPCERHDYARALIKSAAGGGLIAACPLNHADQLKRRLKMIKDHRSNRLRSLSGAAAVLILAGVSVSLGAPGMAHPHPEGEGARKEQRIILMERMAGDARREGATKSFTIRRGANGEIVLPEGCDHGDSIANVDEQQGNQRTRVVLCGRADQSPADRAETIERARERILANEGLTAEQRERIREALERELARVRGR